MGHMDREQENNSRDHKGEKVDLGDDPFRAERNRSHLLPRQEPGI